MAREQRDREDLLAEATALAERVSLRLTGYQDPIVIGFRRDGSASFYLGPDPVYQFTSAGKLRRAFVSGLLYKAERGCLVALRRQRTAEAIELVRRELTAPETGELLSTMGCHVDALRVALADGQFELVGQVPAGEDVVGRVRRWLDLLAGSAEIASSPRAQ